MAWYRCGGTPSEVLSLPTPSEASGAIARFNTDLTENLLSAVAEFSASQASGTPTPSTPIPIVGVDKVNVTRTGKNLIAGIIESAGISTIGVISNSSSNNVVYAPCKAGQKYTIKTSGSVIVYAYFKSTPIKTSVSYDNLRNQVNSSTTTITAEIDGWIAVRTPNTDTTPQIEFGESATTYEAPTVVTALINLGGTYYGGEVDAVTGKITLTSKGQKIKDMTFTYNSNLSLFVCTTESGIIVIPPSNNQVLDGLMSECYLPQKASGLPDKCIGVNTAGNMIIADTDYTDVTAWKAAVGENLIIIPLATPIVVYASNTAEIPTIVGDNQVFADSGNIAVKFFETVGHKI